MTFSQSIILSILQGLTEFLPISSSGHLVLFQNIFGISTPPIAFDVLVHLGTTIALLVFFRRDIKNIFKNFKEEIKTRRKGSYSKLIFSLVVGTIPVMIVGIFLKSQIETIFNTLLLTGISFFITAFILFLTLFFVNKTKRNITEVSFADGITVGIFQILSILPGISRSGVTISAGIFRGLKKESAFKLSFFLGIIAILGANLLEISEISSFIKDETFLSVLGLLISTLIGFLALRLLKKIVFEGRIHYFGIYCIFLGIICVLLS